MARRGNNDAEPNEEGMGGEGRPKRGYRAVYSRHRDYFVRLYALNHPVGFLSRADGSRSRIKACGLLRASIMTQSTIHLAPTLLLTTKSSLSLFLPFCFFLCPDFSCHPISLYLAKIIRPLVSGEPEDKRSVVFLVTACFTQFPLPLYSLNSFQLLFIFLFLFFFFSVFFVIDPHGVDLNGVNSCARVTLCCL